MVLSGEWEYLCEYQGAT